MTWMQGALFYVANIWMNIIYKPIQWKRNIYTGPDIRSEWSEFQWKSSLVMNTFNFFTLSMQYIHHAACTGLEISKQKGSEW